MEKIRGNAFLFSENIDTDQILPGYAMSYPIEALGKVALRGSAIPDYADRVQKGDVILADHNFGCGSSREQAPVALKNAGTGIVVAKSFARIFRKNAINIGLPVATSPQIDEIKRDYQEGDALEIDLVDACIVNTRSGARFALDPIAETTLETLEAGGLINKVRKKLIERGVL